ncbi:MAG: bifunctional demethylmenaquinone methyltransferase/2-methoxy-6-polyprenyl-1,4-benzoquinol methylase UbiE, partial [Bacteroidales bacterium]|nr:bifunctional demethylmenaquinone methyltransferase/2-methoxy-6-polyprenyl-1,4-benzoquinol methylase UbiE [Bacteroidales bacterium]
ALKYFAMADKQFITSMFDSIAGDYDSLNHLFSLNMDRRWRRKAVAEVMRDAAPRQILDVACGTGDLAVALAGAAPKGGRVTGVDISKKMLALVGRKAAKAGVAFNIKTEVADAEHLPYADGTFDAVTCAFGVRNFVHLEAGLREMLRVLKPGGKLVILELATPDSPLVKPFYRLYTRHIIPRLGHHLAGNREAYTYLPNSIERFPKGKAFIDRIPHSSLLTPHSSERKLTFGVCRMYTMVK